MTSLGSLTSGDAAFIGDLPFGPLTDVEVSVMATSVALASGESIVGHLANATSYIALKVWDSTGGGVTDLTIGEVTASGSFVVSGCYKYF